MVSICFESILRGEGIKVPLPVKPIFLKQATLLTCSHAVSIVQMAIPLLCVLNCCTLGSPAEIAGETSVLAGADVTLNCLFDKPSKPVQLNSFAVEWNVVNHKHSDKKRIVYTIEDGTAHVNREGSVVNQAGLLQGNASLQLRNVTVGDEGVYTCRVITPVMYTETTPLEVSGITSSSLFLLSSLISLSYWFI